MIPSGPWQDRIEFAPGGGLAYRPGELLVRSEVADRALATLTELFPEAEIARAELLNGTWTKVAELPDLPTAFAELHGVGISSQPNHVLFATGCCPPHPAEAHYQANPFFANPFFANPFFANPFFANPFFANPFFANPFFANAAGGCCCCGGSGAAANPFFANPFFANSNPVFASWFQSSGRRRSSAQPAERPALPGADPKEGVRIAILDTGLAQAHEPPELAGMDVHAVSGDVPDGDNDGFLDPVAGHGTFIAGVIEQIAPGCRLELKEVLSAYGDGSEDVIAEELLELALRPEDARPHLVNLSFGGYSVIGMEVLADAIQELDRLGIVVVASAGNDATCVPTYPSVMPEVVSVGALDEDGSPAVYTNYGPWVRACTQGTDVVSLFFDDFNGAEPPAADGTDADDFHGWARWSGTSFAAPRVVATLALEALGGVQPTDAVAQLIDDPQLERVPMLGTVVQP